MSQPIPDHIVLRIRAEWDANEIDTRAWANALDMNPESVRRIGRRDTYRHVGRENSREILGVAPLGIVKRGPDSGTQRGIERKFTFPGDPEPDEAEIAASLARLQERMESAQAAGPKVDDLLEEMAKKGRGEGQ
jgi:hypothetical protein